MKELDVFRYLKKYRAVIAGVSILAGAVFFLIAQFRIQQYTAATVIEYTGSRAGEGFSPDGSPIDPSEIYSTNLVAQAMKVIDSNRQVILLCDSWYPKAEVVALAEQFDNLEMVCNARVDTALYELPPAKTGKRAVPENEEGRFSWMISFLANRKPVTGRLA